MGSILMWMYFGCLVLLKSHFQVIKIRQATSHQCCRTARFYASAALMRLWALPYVQAILRVTGSCVVPVEDTVSSDSWQ